MIKADKKFETDKDKILEILSEKFNLKESNFDKIKIRDGVVEADCHLYTCYIFANRMLPFKFSVVNSLTIEKCLFESLVGCPEVVRGNFSCGGNLFNSLVAGPEEVHGDFICNNHILTSLEGFPKILKGTAKITWAQNLPMLRILRAPRIDIVDFSRDAKSVMQATIVESIMKKHIGGSRTQIIACQGELIARGFSANARW